MEIRLITREHDFTCDVPERAAYAIESQLMRMNDDPDHRDVFLDAFLKQITRVTAQLLDEDLTEGMVMEPPSEKQVAYANGLARQKGITVPRQALMDRKVMKQFLDEHAKPIVVSKRRA